MNTKIVYIYTFTTYYYFKVICYILCINVLKLYKLIFIISKITIAYIIYVLFLPTYICVETKNWYSSKLYNKHNIYLVSK